MLQRTIVQIKDALRRASERIADGETLLEILEAAGEDTSEVSLALVNARSRRDQWVSALEATGHMSSEHDE